MNLRWLTAAHPVVKVIAAECAVTAMPTFALISQGVKVDEAVGAGKTQLRQLVEKWASSCQTAPQQGPAKQPHLAGAAGTCQ